MASSAADQRLGGVIGGVNEGVKRLHPTYFLLSVRFCMTTAQEASPVTDITVRPMSMMRSMPAATATHSTGICADAKTMAINASDPPGMPGVPIEATVEAKAMARYWLKERSMPQQVLFSFLPLS